MLLSCQHYRSWLKLGLLTVQNLARRCFFFFFFVSSDKCLHPQLCLKKKKNHLFEYMFLLSIHFILIFNCLMGNSDWNSLLERFVPRQIAITRPKREWELDILSRYRSMVRFGISNVLLQ